jgi:hypothetical protein
MPDNVQFGTNQLILAAGGGLLAFSAALLVVPGRVRRIVEWVLLAFLAAGVVLAADLFLIDGIAGPRYRLALAGVVVLAVGLLRIWTGPDRGKSLRESLAALAETELPRLRSLIPLALQLALLVLVVRLFNIENQVFYGSFILAVAYGFAVHFFLLPEHRLPFYLFLSIAVFIGVLGLLNAAWLIVVVFGMVGILHLKLPFGLRSFLVLVVGLVLAVARTGVANPVPAAIWPILGSVLMFRLIIYAYDLKHSKKPMDFWSTMSYFFLLPNVMFPFFPVVDHNTFVRSHFNEKEHRIYQTGIEWILRGVLHLVAYRVVYYYFAISPGEVDGSLDLIRLAFSSFLLYLQVSGKFHMIVGLLHLYGFNLPRTNDDYLLARNFTDLWRRANIYWKDFMTKIFYYPSYTWLSRRGIKGNSALVLTTVYVFFWTWFLHGYYWFWIRGTFLLTGPDILFWTLLAVLVMINILQEARQGRARSLSAREMSPKEIVVAGLNNALTLVILTCIWTLWTSPTVSGWLEIWSIAFTPRNLLVLAMGYAGVAAIFIGLNWIYRGRLKIETPRIQPRPFTRRAAAGLGLAGLLFLAGTPALQEQIGGRAQVVMADLTTSRLNEADADLLLRGYYDNLITVSQFNAELWDLYSKRPTDWPTLQETAAADLTQDFRVIALQPSVSIEFHGARFTTNSHAFRDREYTPEPPPGTLRTVLLGPSFVMGSGAADEDVFEAVLEDRLNAGGRDARFEILNFGLAGFSPLQELFVFERQALEFEPGALFYVAHQLEESVLVRNLANSVANGHDIPYEFLEDLIARAGVGTGQTQETVERTLGPFQEEILAWVYARLIALCEENGVEPVWIYLPAIEFPDAPEDRERFRDLAAAAGFTTIDLYDVFDGQDIPAITVAAWDLHPNEAGHRLIAEALYAELASKPATAGLFELDR